MTENIDVTSREFPGFFVLAAITQAMGVCDHITSNPVEVKLLVNGIELPFTQTMNDIYRRMEANIDSQAHEIAEKMVTETGLAGIAEALRECEWKVKEAISRVKC